MISLSFIDENYIIVTLIVILDIWLGLWVYRSNRKSKINQQFSLLTFFLLLWAVLCYLKSILPLNISLILVKLAYGVVALFYIPFYFFLKYFPREEKTSSILDKFILGICVFLFFFALSNRMVKEVKVIAGKNVPILGEGRFIYLGLISGLLMLILFSFLRKYSKLSEEEKLKSQYFLIGLGIFIFMNSVFNIVLPLLQGQAQYSCIGNHSAVFLLLFTAYAIVKRQLFGIKVVLTEILVGAIAILLLVDLFLSKTPFEYFWKGILFFTFLIFGNFLIKSVIREIKLRKKLEEAYQKLKKLDEAKTEFVSITSHQLRGPLGLIKGYLWMILNQKYGPFPEKLSRPLKNTFEATQRLVKVVNDLLNLSRIELGKISLEKRYFQIEEIVDNIYKELLPVAQKKKLEFKIEKPKRPLPKILGDSLKIREAIFNLVDNAIKYTQQGFVKISLEEKKGFVLIKIADSGIGFDPQEIKDLFEKFRRVGRGKLIDTQGTGLGLYIAKKFIELHKGRLWAESPGRGKGSTFYIKLPFNG